MRVRSLLKSTFACLALVTQILLSAQAGEVLTPGFLKLSIYQGIPGSAVADLTSVAGYPGNPAQVRYLRSFDTRDALPTDELQDFGGRIEGFITPLETGEYHFFLRSDAQSQLFLSTDDTEASAVMIAEETDRGDAFLEPETFDPATTSAPVLLAAGTRYFIMVLYKGSSGGGNNTDFAQVAWRKVGDSSPALSLKPIDGAFLSGFASDAGAPTVSITESPGNGSAAENAQHTFTVSANVSPTDPAAVQWQRNGVNIPGAHNAIYTRYMDKADNGARFRAIVSVPGASAASAEATMTITDDTTAPAIISAQGGGNRPEVTINFSERLTETTATTTGNYQIIGPGGAPLGITSAQLSTDGTRVTLGTEAQVFGNLYTITVNNVTDRAAAGGRSVAANSTVTFSARGPWLQGEDGFVVFEAEDFDRNLDGLWSVNTDRGVPSGGASMVNYNGAGGNETNTRLEYDILFTKTGTHTFWYRNSGNDGNDDSGWLFLDGERPPGRESGTRAALGGFTSGLAGNFGWSSSPGEGGGRMTFDITTPGVHTISVARREDGSYFDKFLITTDPNFNPSTGFGIFGPAVTLRQGEPLPAGVTVEFVTQPANTTVSENTPLRLAADAVVSNGGLLNYQWQRKEGNGFVDIPGAVGASYNLIRTALSWNDAVVRVKASTTGLSAFSDEARITVTPETQPPVVMYARGLAANQTVLLEFSELVNRTTAENLPNYSISAPGGILQVLSATLLPGDRTVRLSTGAQTIGTKYHVTINGVNDLAATPNAVVNGVVSFFSLGPILTQGEDGLIVFEAENFDRNSDGRWVEDSVQGTPSGGVSVVLPNETGGSEDSRLEYDLNFTRTGTHIIWYRAYGPSGTDDSAWLHLDGARPAGRGAGNLAAMSGFNLGPGGDFIWRSSPFEGGGQMTFEITNVGLHTIALANREDGAYFDKFVITTDPGFNPQNYGQYGPPETREGVPPPADITITSPTDNQVFGGGQNIPMNVNISAQGRQIVRVEFFEDNTKIGEATQSPFAYTWENAPAGTYLIRALLTDDVGDIAVSEGVSITVEAVQEPRLTISLQGAQVEIQWDAGTLQSGVTVLGPWEAVPEASAPSYRTIMGVGPRFFRAVK